MCLVTGDLVLVAYDQTNTQGVADSVVKYLRRDHAYEVLVCGPGHGRELSNVPPTELQRARFFLELDAVSGNLYHAPGIERLHCPRLAWFVDSHKKPQFHQEIAQDFDVVFFTMWAWGGLFGERGRWLPVHHDAEWIGPRDTGPPRFDVGFVGSRPRERTRALQELAQRHGWSLLLETTTGPREKELTADLYAQCKIVFNTHVANDLNFRMVEALACRRLLVTDAQRNGQYELFRDREHVVYYKDDRDLEAVLLHYLRHDAERDRIAAAGHALVSQRHTTAARVQALVAVAEELALERGQSPRLPRRAGDSGRSVSPTPAPSTDLRLLLLGGKLEGADADLARVLAAGGAHVELVALEAPTQPLPGVRVHLATGPCLPELSGAPRARALLENVPLLDAATTLVHGRTVEPPHLVLTLRLEHAAAASSLGRPFAVIADTGFTGADNEDLALLESAALVLVSTPAAHATILADAPALGRRLEVLPSLASAPSSEVVTALLALLRRASAIDGSTPASAPSSRRAADVRYDRDYMLRYGYCVRSPEEARLKVIQAGLIARVLQPRRALVAGCAAGELLLPLLARDVDAWGFDAAKGLDAFVYPEVRDRIMAFDVTDVGRFPFDRAGGGFDTFVAIDLFEHVDEDRVDAMLDGVAASFDKLALVISSSPAFEGHVCVKPFPWWLARLEARGFELLREPDRLAPGEAGTYGVRRFDGVRDDMSEQLVFLRRRVVAPALPLPTRTRAPIGRPARPDVSIAVVCCDRPDVLAVTLESTRASIVTSSLAIEWLAFDNGSGPPVRRVLDEGDFDVVLRSNKNRGLAPALDALFREAQGRYLLTLEDDWRCLAASTHWLELAVATLDTHPDVGVVRLRRRDDDQCGHFKRHRLDVALRHHPWSVEPLPDVVETREVAGRPIYVAAAEWVNWTHNPTLCRREVREWLGPLVAYLPDPRDHRPRDGHPGLEGAVDTRWRHGPWKVAKLVDGPFTHIGDKPAQVVAS